MERTILHCDMNNFFASVECAKDPGLKNYPLAVCGSVEERHGIVLAKNQLAKSFGVSTGEPIFRAKQKCPALLTVPPDYDAYIEYSNKAKKIYCEYTDLVEPFGIDECWLDVSGSERLFGNGRKIADILRERIKRELGVSISVGVSFNKVFAKLGSDMKKPDAVTEIPYQSFRERIWSLPVSDLLGVGGMTRSKLLGCGIFTIGDLANAYPSMIEHKLGKNGLALINAANGRDLSPVLPCDAVIDAKSISHGTTPPKDMESAEEIKTVVLSLCEEIGHRLIACRQLAGGVAISGRYFDLKPFQCQCKLAIPTDSYSVIAKRAISLFFSKGLFSSPLRSVSVSAIDLCKSGGCPQTTFFGDMKNLERSELIDRTMDDINCRYGKEKIRYGLLFSSNMSHIRDGIGFSHGH